MGWDAKTHTARACEPPPPPPNPQPRGSHHPFSPIYGLSFLSLSFISACLLLRSRRAEPSGALPGHVREVRQCCRALCHFPNVSMRVLWPQTLQVCLPKAFSRLWQKEGCHWTGRINKSRCSHCSVTFSPSTANSGSSQRTHPPLASPAHQPLGSHKYTVRGAMRRLSEVV